MHRVLRRFPLVAGALLAAAAAAPARADAPLRPLTVWAAPTLPLGRTKHDLDAAAGIDADLIRRAPIRIGASVGYLHAFTADAGNVHRFPVLITIRRDVGKPLAAASLSVFRPYVGAGVGAVFSDENSGDIGVGRRTELGWALLAGAEIGPWARAELRFAAGENPSRDGTFLLCLGLHL